MEVKQTLRRRLERERSVESAVGADHWTDNLPMVASVALGPRSVMATDPAPQTSLRPSGLEGARRRSAAKLGRSRAGAVGLVGLCGLFSACDCDENLSQLAGDLLVEPGAVDFMKVPVGGSAQESLQLSNLGNLQIQVTSYEVSAPFSVTAMPETLGPGGTTTVDVSFTPTAAGMVSGTLVIHSSDREAPTIAVPLTGEGIQASVGVDPLIVDFGEVLRGDATAMASQTITVTNRGSDTFEVTGLSLLEDAGGAFTLDMGSAIGTYAPGDAQTFEARYAPIILGEETGRIQLTSTAPDGASIEVSLRGQGVGPRMEVCSVSQDGTELCTDRAEVPRANVGGVEVGSRGTGAVRVLNHGDRPLDVTLAVLGMGSPEMTFSPDARSVGSFSVMPSGTWLLDIAYVPVDYAYDAVNLSFSSNDPDLRNQVVLVEGATPKSVATPIPQQMTFRLDGAVTESFAVVELVNCGDADLTITQAPVLRQTGSAFSIRNPYAVGASLVPGPCDATANGLELDVVFTPPGIGNFSAELDIHTNDPINPVVTVTVAGARS